VSNDLAHEARALILGIDSVLVQHLTLEDEWLYPTLMSASDLAVRDHARECFEEMGAILGAWVSYRETWQAEAIQKAPDRFATATSGVIGALALRVDRENNDLYPMIDRLIRERATASQAA